MCGGTFSLALLLLLRGVCTATEESQVKTLRTTDPDITHVCPDHTFQSISHVICNITRQMSGGGTCAVNYRFDQNDTDRDNTCDSRVTLQTKNASLFLHISHIKPSDDGIDIYCQCVVRERVYPWHLKILVNESHYLPQDTESSGVAVMIGLAATVAVMISVGLILWNFQHRRTQLEVCGPSQESTEEQQDIEPYGIFTERKNALYSTVGPDYPDPLP